MRQPLCRFSDWPNPEVPDSPGLYAVWEEGEVEWVVPPVVLFEVGSKGR
ncbi:MAG: hypothetical protein HN494_10595 [Opitutae bacterium]|nr:hypothetical protein [Opitutae bacterium]MBT4665953.1 hypothetical protein [Opitutae bacterium]MBT7743166.1 hypothetical protein [Opitutae bacterium]